jgi:hypothetical protein
METNIEEDRPSAGTACAKCQSAGHFCQAKHYSSDDVPICTSCMRHEECDVIRSRRYKPSFFEPEVELSPARSIPPEEFPREIPADIPRKFPPHSKITMTTSKPIPDTIEPLGSRITGPATDSNGAEPKPTKWGKILDSLVALSIGGSLVLPVPEDDEIKHYHNGLNSILAQTKRTYVFRWQLLADPPNNRITVTKLAPRSSPFEATRNGNNKKPEQRNEAAALLKNGASIRETSLATGLSKNTVASVRNEVEPSLPEKCECGAPLGHRGWCSVRYSKSAKRQETIKRMHNPPDRLAGAYSTVIEDLEETARLMREDLESLQASLRETEEMIATLRARQPINAPAE